MQHKSRKFLANCFLFFPVIYCNFFTHCPFCLSGCVIDHLTCFLALEVGFSQRVVDTVNVTCFRTAYIQLRKMNIIPLLNKPYVNEVTLNGQNLYLKCLYSLGQRLSQQMRFRSFKRGTVSLCRSKGCKTTSCQSWRSEKNPAPRPTSNQTSAARVRFPDDKIILQL